MTTRIQTPVQDEPATARWGASVADAVSAQRIQRVVGGRLVAGPGGTGLLIPSRRTVAQDGFPFGSRWCFGVGAFSGASVHVYGGELSIGPQEPVEAAAADLTLSVDYSKVGIEYTFATRALSIVDFGSSVTYDPAYIRRWIHQFRLATDGGVNALSYHRYNTGWQAGLAVWGDV